MGSSIVFISVLILTLVKLSEPSLGTCYNNQAHVCVDRCNCWHCECDYRSLTNRYCCQSSGSYGAAIFGIVFAILVVGGIISCIACCFCACCPYYRYREPRGPQVTVYQPPPPMVIQQAPPPAPPPPPSPQFIINVPQQQPQMMYQPQMVPMPPPMGFQPGVMYA